MFQDKFPFGVESGPAERQQHHRPMVVLRLGRHWNVWRKWKRSKLSSILVATMAVFLAAVAQAITIDMVPVGNVGNAADTAAHSGNPAGQGAVNYAYNIGKYEVTAGQYTAFLNAVAATDTYGLYAGMVGIVRSGSSGSFSYTVDSTFVNRPVNDVSFWNACRFTNWLQNGQPTGAQGNGTTETGAYTLTSDGMVANTIVKNAGATWWVPSEDEWYKAAYHNKSAGTTASYYLYPTSSNTAPGQNMLDPLGNNANYYTAPYVYPIDSGKFFTVVGEFQNSASPYGTFDQGGNVWEWSDSIIYGKYRGVRGGSCLDANSNAYALSSSGRGRFDPASRTTDMGFRVASIPESGLYWAPAAGGGGTGTWSATSTTWASVLGIQGFSSQASTGTLIFTGTAGTITVDGTVTANTGLTFQTGGYVLNPGASSPNINLAGTSAAANTITTDTGVTTIGVALTGSSGMTKAGAGTLVLTNANTYAGETVINAGTLRVNGFQATGNPPVCVNSGGTLSGTGFVGTIIVNSAGCIAPGGDTIGTLSAVRLKLDTGSILNYRFGSTANDMVNVTNGNGLTINGGGFNLYNQGGTTPFATPGTYKLLQYSGAIQGSGISALSVLNKLPGMTYGFSESASAVTLSIQPTTPPVQPRPDPPPVPPATTKNLIIYTHGYNPTNWDDENGPWKKLDQALKASVDSSNWTVIGWDWTSRAGFSGGPAGALNNAIDEGSKLGAQIAAGKYDYVHFIGHSAGSALISEAARMIADKSKGTAIQTTYLSPYAPTPHYWNMYGAYGSQGWSDNYIDYDSWLGTAPTLPNSRNVNVTQLKPSGQYATPWDAHGWPIDFYLGTIPGTSNYPVPGASGYGFPRSLEGGGWDTRSSYPLGNEPVPLGGSGTTTTNDPGRQDAPLDFSKNTCFTSTTGAVAIAGTGFSLATGSPVWMSSLLTINEPVNVLTFDASFVNNGAEGLLAVYWNEQCLGEIDQRYVLDGLQEYSFCLPQTFDPGTYSLAFRLDPYTDTQSSVAINNVATGFATVPEPSTLALLLIASLGLVGVAFRRRRRGAGR